MKVFKSFYIQHRFFYIGLAIALLFILSYFVPLVFFVAQLLMLGLLLCFVADVLLLYVGKQKLTGKRILPDKLSNNDAHQIEIQIENTYNFNVNVEVIDELPEQFQRRDFLLKSHIVSQKSKSIWYDITPKQRGEYHFGKLNIYALSTLGLVARRYIFDDAAMVPTYPGFKQLKAFDFISTNKASNAYGVKKVRRIGHTLEFEQIKEYVLGDDLRSINWKATAKSSSLMVNQFQDEKSQPVYCIIDRGRTMQMPFKGLSLLDYAINASLIISNLVLKKHDKAGVLSFSNAVNDVVVAQRRSTQMQLILKALYNVNTNFLESDFNKLYVVVKQKIKQRSLLILYTNFETLDALNRQAPYLKALAKHHVLIVVFFKNTELQQLIHTEAKTVQGVYDKIIAEKFEFEKRLIINELKKMGIYAILTSPDHLAMDAINAYLKIKARGLL